ncbi:hypothetical protein N0V90_004104 [Kalmusia sp. IMI 367209]|nr:hypothetical protein N0V90_004104 [Kalmusia sp. IMI 367209]
MSVDLEGLSLADIFAQMLLGQLRAADKAISKDLVVARYICSVLPIYRLSRKRQYDMPDDLLAALGKEMRQRELGLPIIDGYTIDMFYLGVAQEPLKFIHDKNVPKIVPCYMLASFGNLDYVEWKLKHDPTLDNSEGRCIYWLEKTTGVTDMEDHKYRSLRKQKNRFEMVELCDFENAAEILGLIDAIKTTGSTKSATKQAMLDAPVEAIDDNTPPLERLSIEFLDSEATLAPEDTPSSPLVSRHKRHHLSFFYQKLVYLVLALLAKPQI